MNNASSRSRISRKLSVCACAISCLFPAYASQDKLEFSGFARIVAGYLNEDNASYNNYENSLTIDSESLIGLRLNYELTDKLSFVTQGVVYANNDRKSKIQWLYADYRPTNNLSFKLGRQRAPLFKLSEVIDVGFAYPWISLPQSVYVPFLFAEIDGILGTYEFSENNFSGSIDAYFGGFESKIDLTQNRYEADIDNFVGIVGSLQVGKFSFRASLHRAHAEVIIDELLPFSMALNQLGFTESADSLEINNIAKYEQFSVTWENLDYFAQLEFSGFDSAALLSAKNRGFYLTLGYNFYPFTTHLTFNKSFVYPGDAPSEIPTGIDPQLDFLANQYQATINSTSVAEIENLTLGLRYDYSANFAFKADITLLNEQTSADLNFSASPFYIEKDAELVQLAIEWVF